MLWLYAQDLGLEGDERERDGGEDEDDDDGQGGQQEDEDEGARVDEGGEEEDESCEGKWEPEMKATRSKKPFYYMVLASMSSKSNPLTLKFCWLKSKLSSIVIITFGIFILKEIPNSCHVLNCDNCLIVEVPPPGWSLGDRPALVIKPHFILALMIQGEERRGGQKDKNLDAA